MENEEFLTFTFNRLSYFLKICILEELTSLAFADVARDEISNHITCDCGLSKPKRSKCKLTCHGGL